ncbi:hypothetical protein MMC06_000418 [Schaereria dolodes]|nr:hypothetical protein [Schaereria dolodes]
MRFALVFFAPALASLVGAQSSGANPFKVPSAGYVFIAGQPTDLTWKPTTGGTVTLQLRMANIPNNGAYTYTPPSDTAEGNSYTIEIIDDTDPINTNYTPQFDIISRTKAISTSASASTFSVSSASPLASASPSSAVASSILSASASAITTISVMILSGITSSPATLIPSSPSRATTDSGSQTSGTNSNTSIITTTGITSADSIATPTSNGAVGLKVQGGVIAVALGACAIV